MELSKHKLPIIPVTIWPFQGATINRDNTLQLLMTSEAVDSYTAYHYKSSNWQAFIYIYIFFYTYLQPIVIVSATHTLTLFVEEWSTWMNSTV